MTMTDGHLFEGTWVNGQLNGAGRAEYPNGDVYEGMFVNNERQGEGKMIFADGRAYEGAWVDGQPGDTAAARIPDTSSSAPTAPEEPDTSTQ